MIGSPLQLTIILAIVLVLFGAKKLRNVGGDVGSAIKNFRNSMREGNEEGKDAKRQVNAEGKGVEKQERIPKSLNTGSGPTPGAARRARVGNQRSAVSCTTCSAPRLLPAITGSVASSAIFFKTASSPLSCRLAT